MKKALFVGLILILGLAIFAGCNPTPPQPTPPEMPKPPVSTATGSPVVTPAGATEEVNTIEYLKNVTLVSSNKENAKPAEMTEVKDMTVPKDAKIVAVKIQKDPAMPKDKELDVTIQGKNDAAPAKSTSVKTEQLQKEDATIVLNEGKALQPGEYMLMITEKGSDKKMHKAFTVGEKMPAAGEEGTMATPKAGEEKPATEKKATEKAGETKPATEKGKTAPVEKTE